MLADLFIEWAIARGKRLKFANPLRVVTFEDKFLFDRYQFVRRDEWPDSWWDEHKQRAIDKGQPIPEHFVKRPNALPWWQPWNAFLHRWNPEDGTTEAFHDHPRWSITVMLKGRIIEKTPWATRELRPGSIVIRSRRAIHAFEVPAQEGEVWTLFIVGRRACRQNTYAITPR